MSAISQHSKDEDCTLDETDLCTECGVYHGDECFECKGRGFHKEGCELFLRGRAINERGR